MKILLTGAKGQLGTQIIKTFHCGGHDILNFDRLKYSSNFGIPIEVPNVDVIIHCAANTDVESCEKNPVKAYNDNTILTDLLVRSVSYSEVKFVYISSTGVYGGDDNGMMPHDESQKPMPQSAYHLSKYLGELIVSSRVKDWVILRVGWLYGGDSPKNFVRRIIKEAKSSPGFIYSNDNQVGNPTSAVDVASCIYQLLHLKEFGLYNCVNEGAMTRYEYVSKIIKLCGLSTCVRPISALHFNRIAPVSNNESAININLKRIGLSLPNSHDSLEKYIEGLVL